MNSIRSNSWLFICFILFACSPASGADWGYEDGFTNEKKDQFERNSQPQEAPTDTGSSMPVEELQATPHSLTGDPKPQNSAPSKPKPTDTNRKDLVSPPGLEVETPLGGVENENDTVEDLAGNPVVNHWLSLLGLCAQLNPGVKLPQGPDFAKQLTDSQKQRFTVVLNNLLAGKEKAEITSIEKFWRALNRLLQDEQHCSNYRLLFRSLLSMRADSKEIPSEERTMIFEALGKKRIAEPGPPPIT